MPHTPGCHDDQWGQQTPNKNAGTNPHGKQKSATHSPSSGFINDRTAKLRSAPDCTSCTAWHAHPHHPHILAHARTPSQPQTQAPAPPTPPHPRTSLRTRTRTTSHRHTGKHTLAHRRARPLTHAHCTGIAPVGTASSAEPSAAHCGQRQRAGAARCFDCQCDAIQPLPPCRLEDAAGRGGWGW